MSKKIWSVICAIVAFIAIAVGVILVIRKLFEKKRANHEDIEFERYMEFPVSESDSMDEEPLTDTPGTPDKLAPNEEI